MSTLPLTSRLWTLLLVPVAALLFARADGCTQTLPPVTPHVEAVQVVSSETGFRLQVDGRDFIVNGMNWDYFPRGTNYAFVPWEQPDDVIEEALEREMSLLQTAGVNAIRQYVGIPPRWVEYIWREYGIYTILNHPLGRYGVTIDGAWVDPTDYSDSRAQEQLVNEVREMVEQFEETPGVLMWLLGNENNYGLVWSSAETEALPEGERDETRARWLYKTFGLATQAIKKIDTLRPVAMANGDLQYMDLIAEEVPDLDIMGSNVYRGISFGDFFSAAKAGLGLPMLFTEFGADAYNAREQREDQLNQARFLKGQWQEIYAEADGMGGTGISLGGLTFQWSDGWWKFRQEVNLDVQDINASWPNAAYNYDFVPGGNNMNEEWWGVMAKGPTDERKQFELIPRAAYYTLMQVHQFDPYAEGSDPASLDQHFSRIDPSADALQAEQR
ncbi:MAG: hypothetical protein ACI9W4_002677 [Rhodothermales bacterium]|jgi:hypothetical protein